MTNDARPSVRMRPMRRASGRQHDRRSRNGAPLHTAKYHTTGAMPHACPSTVAPALPATPQPSTSTNR